MSDLLPQHLANLSPEQQARLRQRLRQAKQQATQPAPFDELFADAARRFPDRVAVAAGDDQLTYAALDRAANRLAHALRDRGVGREGLVGLCLPRSVDTIVGLLAIMKAGGAYVPLDPTYPRERLATMVEDSGLRVVLASRTVLDVLPEADAAVLTVEDARAGLDAWPDTAPALDRTCDDLAYVMYTSGSTGRPKGVQVSHRGFRNIARWQWENYGLAAPQRVAQATSLSFDISVWEFCIALLSGGTLVLPPAHLKMMGTDLADFLVEQGVENISLTPSALATLPEKSLPFLRCVTVGGEACPLDLVRAWAPGRAFFNGYGPTEATVGVCVARYTPDLERVHIGRPLPGARLHVLDARHQLQPIGVVGELFIGGAGVARGYLGRPDLTAEAFIADPFGGDGGRLYRTGDLARFLPDGNIELLGRADDQVKIRGFRVELGEVEAAIAAHPLVRQAAVLLHRDGARTRLVAFVVGREPTRADDLRAFVGERLPAYMVPSVFVPLDALPVNANGKVDRKALAAMPWDAQAGAEDTYVAPRTAVEEQLAAVWQAVLGLSDPVGVQDDFFSLGGDSILSLQVVFRAKQAGLSLTVRQLFEHPTIAELAPVAERQEARAVVAEQGLVTGPVELTPIQRWFFGQGFVRPDHVNQSLLVDAPADLSPEAWPRALRRLVEHHDGLRARYVQEAGRWRAELGPVPDEVPFEAHDLTGLPAGARDGRLLEVAEAAQAGLDLAAGPLFRAVLFTDGDSRRLLLVAHHLVVDVVSWRVLLEDLTTLAGQAASGADLELPPKTSSWQQWAARLAEEAAGEATAAELDHWREQAQAPVRPLPLDGSAEADTVGARRVHRATLAGEDVRGLLQEVPAAFHTRVDDVLLTALAAALGAWAGDDHVRIDVEGHGREDLFDDLDVSRTVGWFTTVSPLRLPVPAAGALADGLKAVKEARHRRPRHGIGYGLLAQMTDGSGLPPAASAEVSFNHLGHLDGPFGASLAASSGVAALDTDPRNQRPHLLDVVSHVEDGELVMEWAYGAAAHDEETIRRLAEHTLDVLRALVEEARRPEVLGYTPSDLPLSGLGQAQLDTLVAQLQQRPEWRASTRRRPLADCYPQTPIQQGLWFQSEFARGEGLYHVQQLLRIDQPLDVDAFRRSWAHAMERHPILRTSFGESDGGDPLQLVWDGLPVPLRVEDWRGRSADDQRRDLDAHLAADRARGFAPHEAPQWRLLLARTAADAYQLAWSAHHTILDGWSTGVLLQDVTRAYAAITRGQHPDLPPTRPYRDYVAWLGRQDVDAAERYWRATLAGVEEATPLPTLRSPGAAADGAPEGGPHARATFSLGEDETAQLQDFAQRHRLTLNTVLQGCWALLLGRYAGTRDVTFGTVTSGRPTEVADVERMVGLFINTLPLRVELPAHEAVLDWLRSLQERNVELRQHEHSALSQVHGWSELPPGAPLFESLFVFENYPEDAARDDALRLTEVGSREQTHYPLNAVVTVGERLGVDIFHDLRRFDAPAVEAMFGHFRQACRDVVASPGAPLGRLRVLTDDERTRALGWSTDDTSDDEPAFLHDLVAAQARRAPDAIAVTHEDGHLTYGELDRRANQLAHWLQRRGVGPEVLVGLFLDRSLESIVGLLGVLKAGGAYVPVDPRYPVQRMAYVVEDARLRLFLTQEHLRGKLPASSPETLSLDAEWATVAAEPTEPPPTALTPGHLAYIIYTSGSTGRPKGVMVTHGNLHHVLPWIRRHPCFARPQNGLQVASLSFDFSVWEIALPLVTGGTLHIPAPGARMIGGDLHDVLSERAIEVLSFTPGALATLPAEAAGTLAHLRTLVVGGEQYSADLVRTWAPGRRFFNVYGPTETTIFASGAPTDEHLDVLHMGRGITNVRLYVLDSSLQPVPVGVPGELCIGGVGVTRGYLNRPDLTAEKFVADPYGDEPGGRLYRSGDLVRYLPDGTVEFVGRIDNQVKVRGFRMELGEVQAVLDQSPLVHASTVLAQPDGASKRLVAYVVVEDGAARDTEALRAHLKEQLPAYMVPQAFVYLDQLPLNSNGKVNRHQLPLPEDGAAGGLAASALPRTRTEAVLATIWEEVLGQAAVGVHDDFFALGGHSLVAVKVVARVQQAFGVDLPVRVLFEQPTVAEVAARVDDLAREHRPYRELPLVPVPRDQPIPATFDQQRVWFMDRLHPGSALYTVGWLLHRDGATDPATLRRALGTLVERHETLRTTFRESGGRVWQVVAPSGTVDLAEADLSATPADQRTAAVRALATELWRRPFDLAEGPLFRTLLVRLSDDESLLVFSAHHAVCDGYSVGVLDEELLRTYDALATGDAPLPGPLAIQYADYAAWQQQWLDEERLRPHLEFWKAQLAGAPALITLPTDRPRPAVQDFAGANHAFRPPAGLVDRLEQLGDEHRTTRFVTLLSAFAVLLARYSGQGKVVIGVPVAGRSRVEAEPLIGFLVDTVALCVDVEGDPTFAEVLQQVRWKLLEAQSHQDVPFQRIVEELKPERSLSYNPVFQVMFSGLDKLFETGAGEHEQPEWVHDVTEDGIGVAKFDLGLSVQERGGELQLSFEYSTNLFDADTVARMGAHLTNLAEQAVSAPHTPVSRLPLLSAAEQEEVLERRNATHDEGALRPVPLHRLVEDQVGRTPEAVALSFEGEWLRYAELDERANRLARALRARGVGPDVRVGVCMERSLDLVVGLLAVLKAGGAYVPLDPDHPSDRLAYIAEDAGVRVTLVDPQAAERVRFLAEAGAEVIELGGADTSWLDESPEPLGVPVSPDHLAYVIYTSGSTGRPKGAMLSHRGIVNRLAWMQGTYGLGADDTVLQKTPFGFDVSVWEFFWPLLTGARLHVARPGGHRDPAYLADVIEREGVSVLHFVPSMLQAFLQHPGVGEPCRRVRHVICSGEALPPEVQDQCLRVLPGARLHNLYGPTEASVDVSYWECRREPGASSVPIGRPVANTQLYVLDDAMAPVPDGVIGELFIGGVQLARGYVGRPGLTAERFVANPFGPGRLYATGDLARFRPDGVIEYAGRKDHQVKIRGYRIEVEEVEAVLAEHPDVEACLVVVHELSPVDKRLTAFFTTRAGVEAGAGTQCDLDLRTHLQGRLPEYMVPTYLVPLDAFPLSPNGKVDRKALPQLSDVVREAQASVEYVAPRTATEEGLAEVWADLLELDRVGIHDDFFDLGGHSLLVASMATEVQDRWGIALMLPTVFQNRTIAQLAERVDESVAGGGDDELDADELFDLP